MQFRLAYKFTSDLVDKNGVQHNIMRTSPFFLICKKLCTTNLVTVKLYCCLSLKNC